MKKIKKIGIISDTHGQLRIEAIKIFNNVDLIIHAGDIGSHQVVEELQGLAPVTAVRGNCDKGEWARELPLSEVVEIEGNLIYVLHDLNHLDIEPEAAGFRAVVFGHSHKPGKNKKGNVLYINPGSAGPRRFNLPVSAALLTIDKDEGIMQVDFIKLA